MSECRIRGCRNLQTTCVDCGRIVCTSTLPERNEWISVKDKLPKLSYVESDDCEDPYDSYEVLLFTPALNCDGITCVGYLVQEQDEEDFNFGDLSWECYIPEEGGHISNVPFKTFTHWMPIPKPPEDK